MRKLTIVLLAILFLFSGCGTTSSGEHAAGKSTDNTIILQAIEELKDYWQGYYRDNVGDGYFEIKNTRVVHIKETDIEEFSDVSCLVEFVLFSDMMGTAPYYYHWGTGDVVIVYKNGSMEVSHNPLLAYRSRTYSNDFSGIVDSIEDYHDDYNCVIKDLL